MNLSLKSFARVETLIFLFFLIGLENIMLPPMDMHDWRQTLTLSIAHNFLDHPNIFFPRMDIGGGGEGIMACEFPIFNYLLAGLFKLFGVHDWYGRLFNWTISCLGLWFFYDLVQKASGLRAALFATLAIMSSVVFEYARKSMPDTFALSLCLSGVWYLWTYLQSRKPRYLFWGFILVTLGMLSKIPFLIMLCFLILPLGDPQVDKRAKSVVIFTLGIALSIVLWWYYYWMPYLLETYHNPLTWPVSLSEGWKIVTVDMADLSWRALTTAAFHQKLPFLFSLMGLGILWTGSDARYKYFSTVYMVLFFLFSLKTGITFPTHDYYTIALVPLMAFCIGVFLDQLKWPLPYSLILAFLAFYQGFYTNKLNSFNYYDGCYRYELAAIMDRYTKPDDKIMVNNGQFNPTLMYWAQRKGWSVNNDTPGKVEWMPDFKKEGLKYILMNRHLSDEQLPYTLLYEDAHFRLYQP